MSVNEIINYLFSEAKKRIIKTPYIDENDFDSRWISYKRCEEINNMKIPCPWGGYEGFYEPYFIMDERRYFSSKDEKIIFCGTAFAPIPDDRVLGYYEDTYLLVKNDKYYLFTYKTISDRYKIKDGIVYSDMVMEIDPNPKIDKCHEKKEILKLISMCIKKTIYNNEKRHIINKTILYKGKEI